MKRFFPFYGSKWNLARRYPPPSFDLVIEPFAGSAGYALYYDAPRVLLIDADPIVVGVWRYLFAVSADEIAALPDIAAVGDGVDNYPLPQEARWLIGFWLNPGSSQPKKSRTAYAARCDRSQLNWGPNVKRRLIAQLPHLAGWSIVEGDYSEAPDRSATWFVDPPYDEAGCHYRRSFLDRAALAAWCLARRGQTVVCEAPGAVWLPFRPIGSFKTSRGRAAEAMFTQGWLDL